MANTIKRESASFQMNCELSTDPFYATLLEMYYLSVDMNNMVTDETRDPFLFSAAEIAVVSHIDSLIQLQRLAIMRYERQTMDRKIVSILALQPDSNSEGSTGKRTIALFALFLFAVAIFPMK